MKKTEKSNFRIEVYPATTVYGITVDTDKNVCEKILEQIKRHVGSVQCANIVSDNNHICSACGSQWTEDGDTYNGGCCKADQDAEDARNNGEIYARNERSNG